MNYTIKSPDSLKASVKLPASKSICNRALILNALSYSPYEIRNLSDCDDTEVMVKALNSNDRDFDIKAAGTAMRFLTAFLSKVVGEWTITGTERMKNRPIKILVDALNALGARVEYMEKEGYPPLRIFGSALQGGEISLAGGVSSQYISALLMICLLYTSLPVKEPGSRGIKVLAGLSARPVLTGIGLILSMPRYFGSNPILFILQNWITGCIQQLRLWRNGAMSYLKRPISWQTLSITTSRRIVMY